MNRSNFPKRKEQRRTEAGIRAEQRAKRSNAEQLKRLDERPGQSTKERTKLTTSKESK